MQFKEYITFLGTNDLKKTSNFYQNILGLTLYKDQKMCLIFHINKQSKIGFCEHIPKIAESPKLNKKFNIYHFFFKDPNGYTIEIQRFLEE